ncbi:MAG TPA: alpha-2-macroglobulin family protein, partial [Segetibacter sp.]
KEMAPNVYVNVSLLQPHAQTINDLPIRMYGVVPVMVEDKNTILKPVIKMPDVIKPEQPNTITVSEANGNDMSYVIAVVDEGLLDLTRFKTPDPHSAFYAREALGVKSWDLFDYVIGAWGGDLERILTIGGDSEAAEPGKKKANRFKPIVQFFGPFKSYGSSKSHTFTLPAYMGSVRAMVIAGNNGAYGFAEKAVAVKKPLMMLATMPRVLGPTEQLKIPVTVFATENNIRNVSLSIQSNPFIEPIGATNQTITFTSIGEQQVYFDARVKTNTGIGKVKLIATSGKERTEYEVELDIRNPNPPITSITEKTLAGGQNFVSNITAIGTSGNKAVVEISSIPAINLESRLQYLIQYPHGCIEQITSSVFPQLVLNQLLELSQQQKLQVDGNIRRAIDRIKNFQAKDGGFSYWPNEATSDEWGTSYAGHYLLEAAERGFNVPSNMLQQWKFYQKSKANAWNQTAPIYYGGDLVQAYRLFLLALAKAPELGAMNRLKEYKFITPEAKWRLAAAYQLVGQTQVALQLISGLPTNFSQRPAPGITYGSQLRDQAMVLETLTLMNRKAEGGQLVRAVANQLSRESWYSTQTTAYALIAISKFCGQNQTGSKIIVSGSIAGKNVNLNSQSNIIQTAVTFTNGKANINISNKGNNVLYVRIINQGQPVTGEGLAVSNHPNTLAMTVNFITTTGATIDPASIKQGTDFIAKVTVKNTGQKGGYEQMALSQIFPSGWEILNTRLYNAEGAFKSSPSEYMYIRDDRVYHYFDLRQSETLNYYVQLNAAYAGRYYWPGTYCEAMYDNSISSGVSGKWVEVVQ